MQTILENVSALLVIIIIVGLIKPNWVLAFSKGEKTRKNVLKYLGIPFLVMIIIMAVFFPDAYEDTETPVKQEVAKKEKKKDPTPDVNPQKLVKDLVFQRDVELAARYFIEEYDKQKVKKVTIKDLAVYSENPVKDQIGEEFKYSFMASGRYEEKGTGSLKDFMITLVYKDDKDLDEGNARCIQYFNTDTGVMINAMSEEDDILLKLE